MQNPAYYFDHCATTPIANDVVKYMQQSLESHHNCSSPYTQSVVSKKTVEDSRKKVAKLFSVEPSDIYFTSGGTESNNWALKGSLLNSKLHLIPKEDRHIIISNIEHASIFEVALYLSKVFHFQVSLLETNNQGHISLEQLKSLIKLKKPQLVSIMMANNEIGSLQPISEVGKILKSLGIHFHVDGVQAVGKIPISIQDLNVDTFSFAAHKFYGPKGIGGLYINSSIPKIEPLLHGGGQEFGLRSGTEPLLLIQAMGVAAEKIYENYQSRWTHLKQIQHYLIQKLVKELPEISFNGPQSLDDSLPNLVNVRIPGINSKALCALLDLKFNIQISTQSACSNNSGITKPSHVLKAIGLSNSQILSSFRISWGHQTSLQDVNYLVECLKSAVKQLSKAQGPSLGSFL